jgi:hypothetical protein
MVTFMLYKDLSECGIENSMNMLLVEVLPRRMWMSDSTKLVSMISTRKRLTYNLLRTESQFESQSWLCLGMTGLTGAPQ